MRFKIQRALFEDEKRTNEKRAMNLKRDKETCNLAGKNGNLVYEMMTRALW